MRFLMLALMILLLPLRGLMGDAMATHMSATALLGPSVLVAASGTHHHEKEEQAHSHPHAAKSAMASAAHDCLDHASAGQPSSPDVSQCNSCPTCQACNIVGLFMPGAMASFALRVPLVQQQASVSRFTSADRALSVKPPIS